MAEGALPVRPLSSFLADLDDWGDAFRYAPHTPDERTVRLLGPLAGKRVLLLGCGAGSPLLMLSRAGAKVIAVEPSVAAAELALRRCAASGLIAEVHQRELAELAFVRADTIDLVISAMTLSGTDDLLRVFRQLHRVLRPDAPIVASLPHPFLAALNVGQTARTKGAVTLQRYGSGTSQSWRVGDIEGLSYPHRFEDIFVALNRTNFRVDALLEPPAVPSDGPSNYWYPTLDDIPAAVILRAKKVGL